MVRTHNKAVKPVPLRSTGQILSSFFVVLLRKIFPQKSYLKSSVYRNVMGAIRFESCLRKVRKSKTRNFMSWFVLVFLGLKLYRL